MGSVRFVHAVDDYSVGRFTVLFLKLRHWPKFDPDTLALADRCHTEHPGPTDARYYDGCIAFNGNFSPSYRAKLVWTPVMGVLFEVSRGPVIFYRKPFPKVSLKNWIIGVKEFDRNFKKIIKSMIMIGP